MNRSNSRAGDGGGDGDDSDDSDSSDSDNSESHDQPHGGDANCCKLLHATVASRKPYGFSSITISCESILEPTCNFSLFIHHPQNLVDR